MRVRIDKAGHQHTAAGVDYFAITVDQFFDLCAGADMFNSFAAHQNRAVLNDRKIAQLCADARVRGSG